MGRIQGSYERERVMGGAHSRTKGHSFEREIARQFRENVTGCDAKRGLQYRDGAECCDVVGVSGFHIECKRGSKVNIKGAMRQAVNECEKGNMPVVVSKDDRAPIYATLLFEDFLEIIEEISSLRRE